MRRIASTLTFRNPFSMLTVQIVQLNVWELLSKRGKINKSHKVCRFRFGLNSSFALRTTVSPLALGSLRWSPEERRESVVEIFGGSAVMKTWFWLIYNIKHICAVVFTSQIMSVAGSRTVAPCRRCWPWNRADTYTNFTRIVRCEYVRFASFFFSRLSTK